MKVRYDPETDSLCIVLRDAPIDASDEAGPGLIVDYDAGGLPVAFEVLSASRVFGRERLTLEVELVPAGSCNPPRWGHKSGCRQPRPRRGPRRAARKDLEGLPARVFR